MPLYDYQCSECDYEFDELVRMEFREKAIQEPCPDCGLDDSVRQVILKVAIGDSVRLGIRKPSGEFNQVIAQIAENNPRSNLYEKLPTGHRKKGF